MSILNTLKAQTRLVRDGLFWCVRNPLNSDMDCKIFNGGGGGGGIFLHMCKYGEPEFIVSSQRLL